MDHAKTVADGASLAVALGAWLGVITGVLSAVASIMAIAWTGIRLYEYFKNKKKISE